MRTADESRDRDSRWDDVEAERRAVEDTLRTVIRDTLLVPCGRTEVAQGGKTPARGEQRLTDEAGRNGRSVATPPHAVAGIERETERRRIALQMLAVVVTWRDALRDMDSAECDLFRVRAHALLNYLDVAVMPYPDLQNALAAARSELGSE